MIEIISNDNWYNSNLILFLSENEKIRKKDILSFLMIAVLMTLITYPNMFNEDSGPAAFEIWRINESKYNIKLVSISEYSLSASFTDGIEVIQIRENEWGSLQGRTFKIRIYPEEGYVWAIWKEGDWFDHIIRSSIIWMILGILALYLRRKGIEIP